MSKNLELQNCLLVKFRNFISIQLDDSNYVTWKFLVETLLKGCGLMKYVDGSFPCPLEYKTLEENGVASEIEHEYMSWVQNDSAVMSILAATLSSNALSFIVGSKTSKEIWCRLKEKYVDTSRYNIMKLKSSLYNIQKGSDCIEKYLLRVKEICDQLAVLEVSMDEDEIIESVLHGLPSEFAVIKAIFRIKTMNSSVSMTEVRSLLLIAEDEIDKSVKSIFEKLKTEMMEHGHSLNKFAPATTPTHVTNAKYDGAIQYNGAVNYGVPPLYFMSTSSSCISAPLNTSGYAQQPPLPQCAAFSSQAFDCKSHIEDLKLVHKANNEKYEAIIDDAKREIHLLTSTVEEFKTELQNAKADWELKELQLVDSVKHLEEENSSMEKEISRLLNLLKSTEKEACAIKEEEAQLKDSMKKIKSEVVYLQKALVEVKAENLKISGSIIDNESALRSVRHENEVLHIKEAISHKKVEADLRIYRGRAGNKPISTSNRNNYDPVVCVGIPVSSAIIGNAIRFAVGKKNNENDIASVAFFVLCWICNYMKNSSWRILYVLFRWLHSRAFVDHGLRKGLVKYTSCWILVLSTTFALIWNVMILIFKEKDITFYRKADLSELLQNSWNVRVIKWPCFLLYNDLLLAFSQAKEVTTNSFNTLFDLVFMLSVCVFARLARFFITS